MSFALCEECWWWLKGKFISEEQVETERALVHFEKGAKLELLKGAVFQWNQQQQANDSTATGAAAAVLSSALSSLTKIASGTASSLILPASKPIPVMVRLSLPERTQEGAPKTDVITKITNYVMQDDSNATAITWTSLELEKNQPKYAGRVALHRVQQVKEVNGMLTLLDHENKALFEAKGDESARWVDMIKEAIKVLAPQIEDEAVASRGVTYRTKQLERLESRQREREEMKKKLGPVTMAHTARAMMAKE